MEKDSYTKRGKNNFIEVKGQENLKPINISVPGDPSSASFYAALCLLNKSSKIILKKVHINPTRIGFFNIIRKHKGKISFKNKNCNNTGKSFQILGRIPRAEVRGCSDA